jgi:phosphatidylglycerophosphatase A
MKNDLFLHIATLGPIGYLPASGTFATVATVIALFFLPYTMSWHYLLFLAIVYSVSHYCITALLPIFNSNDPSQIVVDEVIGCLVTFYAIPISGISLLIGFCLFRFFDITKLGPIGWFERLKGASGVILDDVAAGIVSNIVLRILIFLCII